MSAAEQASNVLGNEPKPGFDTLADFAALLERLYGDSFRLFYDVHGGSTIAGIWNPSLSTERPYKVALGFSAQPKREEGNETKAKAVTLNRVAVLAELERLGEGLIAKLEVRNA